MSDGTIVKAYRGAKISFEIAAISGSHQVRAARGVVVADHEIGTPFVGIASEGDTGH